MPHEWPTRKGTQDTRPADTSRAHERNTRQIHTSGPCERAVERGQPPPQHSPDRARARLRGLRPGGRPDRPDVEEGAWRHAGGGGGGFDGGLDGARGGFDGGLLGRGGGLGDGRLDGGIDARVGLGGVARA